MENKLKEFEKRLNGYSSLDEFDIHLIMDDARQIFGEEKPKKVELLDTLVCEDLFHKAIEILREHQNKLNELIDIINQERR